MKPRYVNAMQFDPDVLPYPEGVTIHICDASFSYIFDLKSSRRKIDYVTIEKGDWLIYSTENGWEHREILSPEEFEEKYSRVM